MGILSIVLFVSAILQILSVIGFIVVYSLMFDWYKHKLGLVMNLSLIFSAIVSLGIIFLFIDPMIGLVLNIIGWNGVTVFLFMRLRLLAQAYYRIRGKFISGDDNHLV